MLMNGMENYLCVYACFVSLVNFISIAGLVCASLFAWLNWFMYMAALSYLFDCWLRDFLMSDVQPVTCCKCVCCVDVLQTMDG